MSQRSEVDLLKWHLSGAFVLRRFFVVGGGGFFWWFFFSFFRFPG